jgi:hypothetical protein
VSWVEDDVILQPMPKLVQLIQASRDVQRLGGDQD